MIIYSSFKKKMQVFLLVDDCLSSPLHFSLFIMIFIPWAAITHLHVSLYDTKGLWGVEGCRIFSIFPWRPVVYTYPPGSVSRTVYMLDLWDLLSQLSRWFQPKGDNGGESDRRSTVRSGCFSPTSPNQAVHWLFVHSTRGHSSCPGVIPTVSGIQWSLTSLSWGR